MPAVCDLPRGRCLATVVETELWLPHERRPSCHRRKAVLTGRQPNGRRARRSTSIVSAALLSAGSAFLPVASVSAESASIVAKRAAVSHLQSQLAAIGDRVEVAAEAYNGARWRLEKVNGRIAENTTFLRTTQRNLVNSRTRLSDRLSRLYRIPKPSLPSILVSSGGITGAVEGVKLLDRIGNQDIAIVRDISTLKVRVAKTQERLVADRIVAKGEFTRKAAQKRVVEGIMRERQRVLNAARGDLRQAIAAEQARVRRQAEVARQAIAAAQSGSQPAGDVLAGPLPSAEGNGAAVRAALTYLGVPYVWGGESRSGVDCSGLMKLAFAEIGKSVPHYTGAIWSAFPKVPYDQLQPGDMVFFHGGGHMGMYIGNGQFVHAPHTGDVVKISSMASRAGSYVGAVRA